MQAQSYEFYAVPENGVITLPDKYRTKIKSRVKIIILDTNDGAVEQKKFARRTDMLSDVSIDTRGWTFDKEEANER